MPKVVCDMINQRTHNDCMFENINRYADQFLRLSLDMHVVCGADGYFKALNPIWENILGWSLSELCQKPFIEFVHPDDRADTQAQVGILLAGGKVTNFQNRYLHKQGHYLTFSWTASADLRSMLLFGSSRDITLQKEQQNQLSDYVENATVCMHLINESGKIIWANQHELDMLGYTKEEYIGHDVRKFHADQDIIKEILYRLNRGERLTNFPAKLIAKNGDIRIVEINSGGNFENTELQNMRCFTRDITDSIKINEIQEHYQSIIKSSNEAIITKTLEGVIISWNHAAELMFGYSEHEAIGMKMSNLFPSSILHQEDEILSKIARGEHIDYLETQRRHKDGKILNVSISISPLYNIKDDIVGVSTIIRDITQQKEHEKKLLQQQAKLQKMNEELSSFAHVVSHDLKAPLRAISSLSQWIEEDAYASLSEESKHNFKLLKSRVSRLDRLINGILDYSSLQHRELTLETVNLTQLMEEVIEGFDHFKSFNITVEGNLPMIRANRTMMIQLFTNLISNAITHHHQKYGNVIISVIDKSDRWQFTVEDDGPGIPTQYHEKIFTIFSTLKPRDKKETTGIGLAIIKHIVEVHGGTIYVESCEGQGARFIFTILKEINHE